MPLTLLSATISASSAAATAHHSEAGSAWAMLPQNVPRVRIGWCAMWRTTDGEQAAERAVLDRLLERRVADAGADAEPAVLDLEAIQLGRRR